jgi:hypothetical protein
MAFEFEVPAEFGNDWYSYRSVVHFVAKPVELDFELDGRKGAAGDYVVVPSDGSDPFICSAADFIRQYTPFGPAKADTHFGHV